MFEGYEDPVGWPVPGRVESHARRVRPFGGGTARQDLQTLPEGAEEGQGSRVQSARIPVEPYHGRDPVAEPTRSKGSDVANTGLSLGGRVDAEGDRASGGEDQRCDFGKTAEESDADDKEVQDGPSS